jgi:putative membrane protein
VQSCGCSLAVLALAGAGGVWLVRELSRRDAKPIGLAPYEEIPKEILRHRYAAGEIDEDEYLLRLAGLSQR